MSEWKKWDTNLQDWDSALQNFVDHTIYQSSSWANHQSQFGWDAIRVARTHESAVEALAQVLIRRAPLGVVVAWCPGGPAGDTQHLDNQFVECIKSVSGARFLYLRVGLMTAADPVHEPHELGWHQCKKSLGAKETLIYDLSPPETERREACSANWKRNLRRSEQRSHRPYIWENPSPGDIASAIGLMDEYKNLDPTHSLSLERIESLVANLSSSLVFVRMDDENGQALSIRAACYSQDSAWDMVAVTTPAGRKEYSSYEVFWKLCQELHNRGVARLDLSGIDPVNNVGVYNFKKGTGAVAVKYLGEWECSRPTIIRNVASTVISRRS
jgi:lipid II:glycine glycyltransferase (peptidoglycan interpeptide bridge formation enzyme)